MSRSLLILILLTAWPLCHCQRRTLITLPTDADLLVVKEIERGQEYWLHPLSVMESVSVCHSCESKNEILLAIRFWHKRLFNVARRALRDQGWCQAADPCRVGPSQAQRVEITDVSERWKAASIPLSGVLPEVLRISVRPSKKAAANASSPLPEEFRALQVNIFNAMLDSAPAGANSRLVITGEDLLWAFRLLKISENKKNVLIDRRSLRRLASWILRGKGRALPAVPALLSNVERQLTVTSLPFRPGMEHLLPTGYHVKEGELLFALRKLEPQEQLAISLAPQLNAVTMKVKVPNTVKLYALRGKISGEKALDALQRLDEQITSMMKALNESEAERRFLKEKLNNLEKVLNESNLNLFRAQVSKLANVLNASHILNTETMNLLPVDDCYDIKQRKLKSGIYFLKSIARPVLCTEDGELMVLRRSGSDLSFNVSWSHYERGIGDPRNGDFFIGLKNLSALTWKTDVCMTLSMTARKLLTTRSANYDTFRVGPSVDNYRLSYSKYKGTLQFDVLSVINNQMFTTFDRDNDNYVGNCAQRFHAGNWFNSCFKCNFFGPYRNDASSGMCSKGFDANQLDVCVPLASVTMLLRKKNASRSRRIVFSAIAPVSSCSAKVTMFKIPSTGLYTVTVGGASGGLVAKEKGSRPGGRGAKLRAQFFLEKGTNLAASAGCRGGAAKRAGHGGDASWLVSRTKELLLAVAGGGGGSSYYNQQFILDGMHGRATPDGGDSWRDPFNESGDAKSILLLAGIGPRGKGWSDLRERLLTANSGDFRSGGLTSTYGGGGGGGFEGGVGGPSPGGDDDAGGGGGSFCNSTEASTCSVREGGNTRPTGFIIIEKDYCF